MKARGCDPGKDCTVKLYYITENEIRIYSFCKALDREDRCPVITCNIYKLSAKASVHPFWGATPASYTLAKHWDRLTDRETGNKFYKQILEEGCTKEQPKNVYFEI